MKNSILFLLVALFSLPTKAQSDAPYQLATSSIPNKDAKFLLFPTKNIHIFLKLNTSNGEVSMVQYSTKHEQIEIKIKSYMYPLVTKEEESNGRFFLYPTTNIYNFILLDQIDGRVWQLQWGIDEDSRMLIRIIGDTEYHGSSDGVLITSLELKNGTYYLDGDLFNGIAFFDKDRMISQTFLDGRVAFLGEYNVRHKNGHVAYIFYKDRIDEVSIFKDEEENRITKEEFEEKYPGMIQKAKDIVLNPQGNKAVSNKQPVKKVRK
jgi:hypothetical protein